MALRGNLRDFSLPDVFQLITFSKKTGVLRIVREDDAQGSVWFRDGEAFFASSNWHAHPLGARLVEGHRITPQALSKALEMRKSEGPDGRRLGSILVDEGYITREVLETFVQDQIQDTIFDLMRWDDGEFDFEAMPDVEEEDIGLTVSIENIVMEGSRRLEEWNRIRRKIPSMDIVFKMATAPGEGTFEISLKPMEWQLLLLIDCTRSVADLAVATARTDFEVARVVYGLFSAGLLEFATEEEVARHRAERAEREQRLAVVEAERAAKQQAEQDAAIERESALAEQARAREDARRHEAEQATAASAPTSRAEDQPLTGQSDASSAATAAEVTQAATEPAPPVEVPEFLGAPQAGLADEQVLDEFMGALLGETAPPAPLSPVVDLTSPAPYVPVEEPAFMGVAPVSADDADTVAAMADILGIDTHAVPAPAEQAPMQTLPVAELDVVEEMPAAAAGTVSSEPEPMPVAAQEVEPESMPVAAQEVEPEPMPVAAQEVEPEPTPTEQPFVPAIGGFMLEESLEISVGDMVAIEEPEGVAANHTEVAEDALAAAVAVPADEGFDALAAIAADLDLLSDDEPEPAIVSQVEPVSVEQAVEPAQPDSAPLTIERPASPQRRIAEPASVVGTSEEQASTADFASNLMALGLGELEEPADQVGFDEDLLADISSETQGVISTDSFMSDFSMDDLGLAGGLDDEISALTGVERKAATHRPKASVNQITDQAGMVLKRDSRVDRDTLMKIIDGVKNL